MVAIQLRQLDVPAGQRLAIHNLDWQEFEAILDELGDKRAARIAYSQGILEIRMPTPEHEVDKELIGDCVKIIFEELEIDCECFGSTTFKRKSTKSGLEPDQCFYIQNHRQMRGKRRMNLAIDPPPDLAIEVDVTSKTQMDAYLGLGVPELWIYESGELKMYVLQAEQYQPVTASPIFPKLAIASLIAEVIEQSLEIGRSAALRSLRGKVRSGF